MQFWKTQKILSERSQRYPRPGFGRARLYVTRERFPAWYHFYGASTPTSSPPRNPIRAARLLLTMRFSAGFVGWLLACLRLGSIDTVCVLTNNNILGKVRGSEKVLWWMDAIDKSSGSDGSVPADHGERRCRRRLQRVSIRAATRHRLSRVCAWHLRCVEQLSAFVLCPVWGGS